MSPHHTILHDPTSETAPPSRPRQAPLPTLDGRTVALFDIGKIRSDEFLDYVEARLTERGIDSLRVAKPTNAKPASADLVHRTAEAAHAVVVALAD